MKITVENDLARPIGKVVDFEKLAWGLFQHVDHRVPRGKTHRLCQSAELVAGTRTLMRSDDLKHHSTLFTNHTVSLTYSTPKSVSEQANTFYLYGSGRWFDYAHIQDEEKAYIENVLGSDMQQIIDEAIVQR